MTTSPQSQLLIDWYKGFETKDFVILDKFLHKDYRNVTYPRSLKRADQTKEEWLAHMKKVSAHWGEFDHTYEFVADVPGKVVTHLQFTKKNTDDISDMFTITHIVTDDDGSLKIIKTEDFIDSKAYVDRMATGGKCE